MLGTLLGGLFFIAFMKDPSQFITLQQKLGADDALNEYIQHTGSALFACPPGIAAGRALGRRAVLHPGVTTARPRRVARRRMWTARNPVQ